jgi:hypothetical protein
MEGMYKVMILVFSPEYHCNYNNYTVDFRIVWYKHSDNLCNKNLFHHSGSPDLDNRYHNDSIGLLFEFVLGYLKCPCLQKSLEIRSNAMTLIMKENDINHILCNSLLFLVFSSSCGFKNFYPHYANKCSNKAVGELLD